MKIISQALSNSKIIKLVDRDDRNDNEIEELKHLQKNGELVYYLGEILERIDESAYCSACDGSNCRYSKRSLFGTKSYAFRYFCGTGHGGVFCCAFSTCF